MFQENRCSGGGRAGRARRRIAPGMLVAFLLVVWPIRPISAAEPPGASLELVSLVPPRACVVLTIDDLRGQYREFIASRLAADLQALPAVKAWFNSEKYRQLEAARDQIEDALQISLTDVRDTLLGDAVVFSLELPPETLERPDGARGLLFLKASDPALPGKLINTLNTIQKNNGEITTIEERQHRGKTYVVRKFPEGSERRLDAYVDLSDGRFVISNSDDAIRQVIDRASAGPDEAKRDGTDSSLLARFLKVQRRLPERALARLFIDPGTVSGLLEKESGGASPGQAILSTYLGALESVAAALVINDGRIAIEGVEVFRPGTKLEQSHPAAPADMDRLPARTLGVASLQVDAAAVYQALVTLVPEKARRQFESLELVLKGILLGQDLRGAILPALGPHVVAVLEAPGEWKATADASLSPIPGAGFPFPVVLAVDLRERPGATVPVAAALENALTTLLAVISLDDKHQAGPFRVVSRTFQGHSLKTLEPFVPFAFTLDRKGHRLVLANSPEALERFLAAPADTTSAGRWRSLVARSLADASSFACIDLAAFQGMIRAHRDRMAGQIAGREHRPRDEVMRDLDNAQALAQVFEAVFWTRRVDVTSSSAFQSLGLLARTSERPAIQPVR